jgi:hypothetical protein
MDACEDKAEACAQKCSSASSLKWDAITSCFSGDQGATLKKTAATYFDKRFPSPVGVPHIEINGQVQNSREEASIIQALCATGIKAGACSKIVTV